MKSLRLLCAAGLMLTGIWVANAKSYQITLGSQVKVGQTQLKAGEYSVDVKGNDATFRHAEGGKAVTIPVKVEKAGKKFDRTVVERVQDGDSERIKAIDIGGSDTQLEF